MDYVRRALRKIENYVSGAHANDRTVQIDFGQPAPDTSNVLTEAGVHHNHGGLHLPTQRNVPSEDYSLCIQLSILLGLERFHIGARLGFTCQKH